jgi:hypothetical protein
MREPYNTDLGDGELLEDLNENGRIKSEDRP